MKLKLRYFELIAITKLLIGWLLAKLSHKEKDLWLFSERGTDARDNGFWMFRYVKENHPEINAKFIITSESNDRSQLLQWKEDLVNYGSWKHITLLWQAKHLISTHVGGFLPPLISKVRPFRLFFEKCSTAKITWLKHGIIKDDMKENHANIVSANLVICGAKDEYEYLNTTYGFSSENLLLSGLARFDGLHNAIVDKKKILLMPTWRKWFNDEDFLESQYLSIYKELLSNKELHKILMEYDLRLIFYPHYEIQPYISEFEKLQIPNNIIIADSAHYDVQQLLKESALLITDYSSVFFDFAYMKKPILYFQFDEVEFRKKHYAQGYYDYHNGLGKWTDNINDLIISLKALVTADFAMPLEYLAKLESFFPIHDANNCKRIYEAICGESKKQAS